MIRITADLRETVIAISRQAGAAITVSYTHLDVYKRQAHGWPGRHWKAATTRLR